ncbi:MAG: DUF2164 family protein [Dehalococcoidia bacterium]|nr:MAG: DUF2164 family protein [Dehalococcoidia bacterium]
MRANSSRTPVNRGSHSPKIVGTSAIAHPPPLPALRILRPGQVLPFRTGQEAPVEPFKLDKDERNDAIRRLATYLRNERDEDWGDLAVRLLFDTFEEQIAPAYYNLGISQAQRATRELADVFEVNLESLKRMPRT